MLIDESVSYDILWEWSKKEIGDNSRQMLKGVEDWSTIYNVVRAARRALGAVADDVTRDWHGPAGTEFARRLRQGQSSAARMEADISGNAACLKNLVNRTEAAHRGMSSLNDDVRWARGLDRYLDWVNRDWYNRRAHALRDSMAAREARQLLDPLAARFAEASRTIGGSTWETWPGP